MPTHIDTIVVGGGVMGSAAAWQLARRGAEVALFGRSAARGGAREVARTAPFSLARTDALELRLLADAHALWRVLESETGVPVLAQTGGIEHGEPSEVDELARVLPHLGFAAEPVSAAESQARWPGLRSDGVALHTPEAGSLDAGAAVEALQSEARRRGAALHPARQVTRIRILGDDLARIEVVPLDPGGEPSGDPEEFDSRRLIVTLGAWTAKLLGSVLVLPRLAVSQEYGIRFALRGPDAAVPSFTHHPRSGDPYYRFWPSSLSGAVRTSPGIGAPTREGAPAFFQHGDLSLGWAAPGVATEPDARDPRPDERERSALLRYAHDWLPGVDAERFDEFATVRAATRDGRFVLDRVGPVAVATAFSRLDFALAPAIGELLADLVDGIRAPAAFSLKGERRAAALASR
ncbi:NAD(P)/FAD-dependent oxidoreductase [Herbiconiux sp. YIM B11900]|uniref:NAD(P)/FAD-dependent oxidoreductase n=1 Tax=Herbiconiux sp. YIM B11900 TaxID=3404131 RepID=UPI003F8764D0